AHARLYAEGDFGTTAFPAATVFVRPEAKPHLSNLSKRSRRTKPTMAKIKQSLAWWCFGRNVAPEKLIAEAARIGYAGVEMCPEENWPKVREAGLKIITLGGHHSLTDGLNKPENHDRIEREINENLAKAQRWEIPALIVFSGNRNGLDDEKGKEITAAGL